MKKRTSIILVLVSLVVMSVSYYLLRFVVANRTFEMYALATLFTLMALLLFYIAYKELLRRLGKGMPVKEDYAVLYGLESKTVTGEVEFYFTTEKPRTIAFMLLNRELQQLELLEEREFDSGGHIIRYNTVKLPNGIYFYCIQSDNQKTMKRMVVQHDNLTA